MVLIVFLSGGAVSMRAIERVEKYAAVALLLTVSAYCLYLLFFAPMPGERTAGAMVWVFAVLVALLVFPAACVATAAHVHVEKHSNLAFALVLFFGISFFLFYSYFALASLYGSTDGSFATALIRLSLAFLPSILCFLTVAASVATALLREWNKVR